MKTAQFTHIRIMIEFPVFRTLVTHPHKSLGKMELAGLANTTRSLTEIKPPVSQKSAIMSTR